MPLRTGGACTRVLLGVLAVGTAAAGGFVLAADPVPARDPAGAIAYVDLTGHVTVVDPRAADPAADASRYGDGPQLAIFPAWSNDGNLVAVVTATPQGARVDAIDVAHGGEPQALLASADRDPIYLSWSPDDHYLAVLSGTADSTLALDLVDVPLALAGGSSRSTLAYGQPFYWVWSATGRSVMVHRDVLRREAVVGISAITEFEVRQPLPAPGAFQAPDISGSGRYLAYASTVGAENYVVVTGNPERGSGIEPVVQLAHRGMVAFAWRPGHEQLSVQGATSEGSFTGDLELLDVGTGVTRTISIKEVVASFWSPDGRWIATLSRRSGTEEVVVAEPSQLLPVQGRPLRLELDLIEADTLQVVAYGPIALSVAFGSQYLPFFDQYSRSHSLWSPDATAVVLPVIGPRGSPLLVVYDTAGKQSELVDGDMPAWNVR